MQKLTTHFKKYWFGYVMLTIIVTFQNVVHFIEMLP